MLGVSIKREEEEALFTYKRRDHFREQNNKESKRGGSYQTRRVQQNHDKRGQSIKEYQRTNGSCFVCGK